MRLDPCLHPLGWGSVDMGVAGLFTSVTPPSEDGKISCGSEGSSISALGFGGAVGKVVGGDSEKSNKKEFSLLKYNEEQNKPTICWFMKQTRGT